MHIPATILDAMPWIGVGVFRRIDAFAEWSGKPYAVVTSATATGRVDARKTSQYGTFDDGSLPSFALIPMHWLIVQIRLTDWVGRQLEYRHGPCPSRGSCPEHSYYRRILRKAR